MNDLNISSKDNQNFSNINIYNYSYSPPDCFFNESCSPNLYRHSFGVGLVLCVGYVLVFILGLIGNSFVIAVVLRSPSMRTVTNYFIMNLAIADVLVIVFCVPANLISSIYTPWMLGLFMCKSFTYIQTVSVSASVNSLVAVSLDRFLAIWFPIRPQLSKKASVTIIIVIWLVAMLTAIPMAIFFKLKKYENSSTGSFCVEEWPSKEAEKLYFLIAHLLLCYLLPLKLISAFYISIWIKVAKRSIPGDDRSGAVREMQQRSKIKVVKMLAIVVLVFMLSWLPLYIIFARIKMGDELSDSEMNIVSIVFPVAQWLGSSNSCINPILYAFLHKKFKTGFLALIRSRSCCDTIRSDVYTDPMMRCSSYYSSRNPVLGKRVPGSHKRKTVVYSIPRNSIQANSSPKSCQNFDKCDYLQTKESFHLSLKSYRFGRNKPEFGVNNKRRTSSLSVTTLSEEKMVSS